MADLSSSKAAFASQMVTVANRALLLAHDLDELSACYGVHGFDVAGKAANAFTDQDFTGSLGFLSAQTIADVMFALGTLDNAFSSGVRNSLREAVLGGLPA